VYGVVSQQPHVIYEFGEFQLDPLRRVLSSRENGKPLAATGRVFDLLLCLVEHAGELLDKRTLMDAVWRDVVVEEANLTQTVHTLRRLLSERPNDHRFIVTVPGRGYRFVAAVTTCTAADEPRDVSKTVRVARRLLDARKLSAFAALALVGFGLSIVFRPPAETRAQSPRESPSAQASELYLQGRYFFNRRGPSDVARAREYFQEAVRIDPDYARAWAGLAGALYVADDPNKKRPAELSTQWRQAVQRAVTLGPELAEAHVRAAQYHWSIGNAAAARAHFQRAVALDPRDPLVLSASIMPDNEGQRTEEQIELQRRALAVDPLSAQGRENLGVFLVADGRWDEAIGEFRKALELSPASLRLHGDITKVQILQRRLDDARLTVERVPEGPLRDQCLALFYYAVGHTDAAAALSRLIAHAEAAGSDAALKLAVAEVYAFQKRDDLAFEWLARVDRQTHDDRAVTPGWWMRQEVRLSPFLKTLQTDPRWPMLLASAEARAASRASGGSSGRGNLR
jgi:DNA-binding winged helix-turn-helix (wHTH) protein/Tfp pilus assembly protein PilF